ncbi:hypothetical protein LOTGIDRAFT_156230 [Lottia gigantea]|uniref:M02D8-5-like fifth CUB domain-containing protein n=1 Tax=Lottia gigantea TaxID=225164 RepID=V4B3N2_LOTGI|nr:hypothetical protein LOTGIDRAFT_156230 [Lottia gigantea]ESP04983.1 hypothetical protein LOTGIDRAFT_156230 [Lottia gigantea]
MDCGLLGQWNSSVIAAGTCGGTLSGNGSILINDTFGDLNETCTWTITAEKPYQTTIVLNTKSENGNLLEIYDGDLEEAKNDTELLYNYTNTMGEKWMVSLSNVTTIVFRRTIAKSGDIQIDYAANECNKTVDSGEISPPLYLPGRGGFNCNYTIGQTVVKPYTGILAFLTFNLPDGELMIGGDNFTGTTLPGDRNLGANPHVTATLTINNSSAIQTFSGVVTQAAEQCTKSITVNTTSLTYTLDIPSVHPQVTECRVIFTSQDKKPLMASLLSVKLMGADRLVLNDGSSQGDKDLLGGSDTLSGRRVLSKGSNLWMRVVIDTVPGDREVKLDVAEIESGGRFYNEGKVTLGVSKGDKEVSAATPTDYYYQLVGSSQLVSQTLECVDQ